MILFLNQCLAENWNLHSITRYVVIDFDELVIYAVFPRANEPWRKSNFLLYEGKIQMISHVRKQLFLAI